jgi:hypothetical protein
MLVRAFTRSTQTDTSHTQAALTPRPWRLRLGGFATAPLHPVSSTSPPLRASPPHLLSSGGVSRAAHAGPTISPAFGHRPRRSAGYTHTRPHRARSPEPRTDRRKALPRTPLPAAASSDAHHHGATPRARGDGRRTTTTPHQGWCHAPRRCTAHRGGPDVTPPDARHRTPAGPVAAAPGAPRCRRRHIVAACRRTSSFAPVDPGSQLARRRWKPRRHLPGRAHGLPVLCSGGGEVEGAREVGGRRR